MKKKVLFVATVVKKHINVFHLPYLKMLKEIGYETHVAARNDFDNPEDCVIPNCDYFHDIPFERNPLKINNLKAYKQLEKLMIEENFDIIHCHTPVGGAMPRLVIKNNSDRINSKIIYTAHGFHFYKGAPLKNWLLFYPVEKKLSKYTDLLITINSEDYNLAKRKFSMKRLELVGGVGIDLAKYQHTKLFSENKRSELELDEDDLMVLSVGELNKNKNHEIVIKALAEINNPHLHYFIAGTGNLLTDLERLVVKLGLEANVHFLGFRHDIDELDAACDIFVLPSLREGLNVSLMEAMASGKPCIANKIRGNIDLIDIGKGGFLLNNQVEEYTESIKELIDNRSLLEEYGKYNREKIKQFSLEKILNDVKKFYETI